MILHVKDHGSGFLSTKSLTFLLKSLCSLHFSVEIIIYLFLTFLLKPPILSLYFPIDSAFLNHFPNEITTFELQQVRLGLTWLFPTHRSGSPAGLEVLGVLLHQKRCFFATKKAFFAPQKEFFAWSFRPFVHKNIQK